MALKLYPPGTRKGNKAFVAVGRINGRFYEVSTHKGDAKAASRVAVDFEARVRAQGPAAAAGDRLTFTQAVARYKEAVAVAPYDSARLDIWIEEIGRRRVADLLTADFHAVANRVHAGHTAGTRNRFMRPAIAAVHYLASIDLIPHKRVKLFKEPKPATRAVTIDAVTAMIAAAKTPDQRRLLVWLFHQGTRISATLRLTWEMVDLDAATAMVDVRKGQPLRRFALNAVVVDELREVPETERTGRVFPWTARTSVYNWLRPLRAEVGLHFTPHMARHTVGSVLAAEGANPRQIMEVLGHEDPKSSLRYQAGGIELGRVAQRRIVFPNAKNVGKRTVTR